MTIMSSTQQANFKRNLECDFSLNIADVSRFRVNVFQQTRGVSAVFRVIPHHMPSLEKLNAPVIFSQLIQSPRGMVLVTGPTGSGKSTTLAAMLHALNLSQSKHIVTLEDPIEFVHIPQQCLIQQREVGTHTHSFANALRAALREDPDVILVGELRDLETIRLAITAAETGHLVLGTLHTSSAAKTINRIVDVFPAEEKDMVRSMLSESLNAVISQVLCKRKDGAGRVAAYEVMVGTTAVRNLIREGKVAQLYSAIQTGRGVGMQTLDQSLAALVQQGLIDAEEMQANAK
jgi:twitching motility protein PilT